MTGARCEDCGGRIVFRPSVNVTRCHDCREKPAPRPERPCWHCGHVLQGRQGRYCDEICRALYKNTQDRLNRIDDDPLTAVELALMHEYGVDPERKTA